MGCKYLKTAIHLQQLTPDHKLKRSSIFGIESQGRAFQNSETA